MKRALIMMLVLALLSLCACNKQDGAVAPEAGETTPPPFTEDLPEEEATSRPIAEVLATADPTPEPTAAPTAAPPVNYTYTDGVNEELQINFKYPSTWIDRSSELSVVYDEPVEEGIVPARMAITRRAAGNIVVTEEVGMDKLTAFHDSLKANCTDFKSKRGKRFEFSGNAGFQFTYMGTFSGVKMMGYAAMAYSVKKNAFYLYHFSVSEDRYESFSAIRKTLLAGIRV